MCNIGLPVAVPELDSLPPELAHHHEQQVRLEQKLRQREERHMLIGNQGGGGGAGADPPVPLFPAMGGPGGSAEHDVRWSGVSLGGFN